MKKKEVIERIGELRKTGLTAPEIAVRLSQEGMTNARGGSIKDAYVYDAFRKLKYGVQKKERAKATKSQMITIPVESPEPPKFPLPQGKIIALIADFQDIQNLMKEWIK